VDHNYGEKDRNVACFGGAIGTTKQKREEGLDKQIYNMGGRSLNNESKGHINFKGVTFRRNGNEMNLRVNHSTRGLLVELEIESITYAHEGKSASDYTGKIGGDTADAC